VTRAPLASPKPSTRYIALAIGTVAVALVGYTGYVFYPRFDLPAGTGAGLFLLAAAAGVASFFSPCSFPLLVSILARTPTADAEGVTRTRVGRAILFSTALSIGGTAFLLSVGSLIALAGTALFEGVTFTSNAGRIIRGVVGSLLILLGLIQLNRLRISFRRYEPALHGFLRRQAKLRRRRPLLGFAVFGFGYLLAGFG